MTSEDQKTTEAQGISKTETKTSPEQEDTEKQQPQKQTEQEPDKETKEQPSPGSEQEGVSGVKKKIQTDDNQQPGQQAQPQIKDELTEEVEEIMEEGLEDVFDELTPTQQQEFKIKGEETARKISNLIRQGKAKVKNIFKLIFEWLKTLPGINRFFLEQEAKIKADKIAKLDQDKYDKGQRPQEEKGIEIKQE